ncbi:MAG TPA: hypothetical protein VEI02_09960, partial [Planctomycetota bacterium]|nr:hypothetical protein [Planctomycetota bacterium]
MTGPRLAPRILYQPESDAADPAEAVDAVAEATLAYACDADVDAEPEVDAATGALRTPRPTGASPRGGAPPAF